MEKKNKKKRGKTRDSTQYMQRRDYDSYHFSPKELTRYLCMGIALCAGIDYLFYQIPWLMVFCLPACIGILKWENKECIRRRRKKVNEQFRDALNALNVAIQAGYSVENAVIACVRDLEKLYPPDADILEEFRFIENQLYLSVPVEELFLDLGRRTGIEDIRNFGAVFQTAKRTGGDMSAVIQKVSRMLGDKIDVQKEIQAVIAAKKYEQTIMSLMPAGIILYLRLASPGFLDVLYGNAFGILAMSACLAVYGLSWWMGHRIIDLQV